MAGSLQDQLLKAGLADTDKAKKLAKEKRKQANVARRSGEELGGETREAAREALAAKVRRDRELNEARNAEALRKAINAQIKQLIENHKLPRGRGDIGFNFTDGKKVKKLYVTAMEQKQLAAGNLAIATTVFYMGGRMAAKIAERDSSRVIICSEAGAEELTAEEQEWYKDYEVPDDLMW